MSNQPDAVILLVDDQPDNTDTMMGYLNESNYSYKYLQALNGQIACKVAEKRLPDLIIMDWEMPTMNGYDALVCIKKNPLTTDIPVVMATGRSSGGDLQKALDAGAADYIRKPIEKLELLARVRTCLSLSKYIKEISAKNEHLSDLNREKDGMMDIVAHDLKSPLNNISGLVNLVSMDGELNDEQITHLNSIKNQISIGNDLIRDLLDIHAYEHAESKTENVQIQLDQYIPEFVKNYQQVIDNKHQQLEIIRPSESIMLNTDPNLLRRILDNILTNAIKFSNENKVITIEYGIDNKMVNISITDQGPGISTQDQKNMFKMFKKLSARPTGGESSNGLGLSIINTLVKKLNGNINVDSEVGSGTRFSVILPSAGS